MKKTTYMPAEWSDHQATMIEWPVKASVIYPDLYEATCQAYQDIVLAISAFEPVYLIVAPDAVERVQAWLTDQIHMIVLDHDDAWVRDNGPTFVYDQDDQLIGIDWQFNAWGQKYEPFDKDQALASLFLQTKGWPVLHESMVLEGGSIHVDGEGTLLSTKECLLNPNRNPSLSQAEIEARLTQRLGVTKFLWLEQGLAGDETDGHIDNIACFVKPGVVALQMCYDPKDDNYAITQGAKAYLSQARDAKGRSLEIIEIEGPPARYFRDERLTLSYLNYYLVNGGVILPVFKEEAEAYDREAIEILKTLYPDRQVVAVDGSALIREGGNIHCITQQIPVQKKV